MKQTLPLYCALLLGGGAAGYGLRQTHWLGGHPAAAGISSGQATNREQSTGPANAVSSSPGSASAAVTAFAEAAELTDTHEHRRQLAAAVDRLELADLPAVLALAARHRSDELRLLRQILPRWAELDPRAAAEYTLTLRHLDGGERSMLIEKVMLEWTVADPAAARQWALSVTNAQSRSSALKGLLTGMAAQDPAAAFQLFDALPSSEKSDQPYELIFDEWARRDPAAAAQKALRLGAGKLQQEALGSVLDRWAGQNPEAALTWVRNLPDTGARLEAEEQIFFGWGSYDPEAAGAAALKIAPDAQQTSILGFMAGRMAARNLDRAIQWAKDLPTENQRAAAMLAIGIELSTKSPQATAKFLVTLPSNQQRDEFLTRMLLHCTEQEPRAAADFIDANFTGEERATNLQALSNWGRTAPREALAWMEQHGYVSSTDLAGLVTTWSASQPQDALAWARARPPGPERTTLMAMAIAASASAEPQTAAQLFGELAPEDALASPAGTIAQALTQKDPQKATAWAEQLTNDAMRNAAFYRIARWWADEDDHGVSAWLEKLPPSAARDAALGGFVEVIGFRDPVKGVLWGEAIEDPTKRFIALQRNYSFWKHSDEPAARRWLEQTSALTTEAKQALQK